MSPDHGSVVALLKPVRNAVADVSADLVFRMPALERAYVAIGRRLWAVPGVRTIYRRSVDTLTERLRAGGRRYRRLTVGRHAVWLDVTEFTAKGFYFLCMPYEAAVVDWMLRHLKEGDRVVDVGANHGYHTVIAAAIVGAHGRVYAFEPSPLTVEQLRQHVAVNGFEDRVEIVETALSDRTAEGVPLYLSTCADNSGLSSLQPEWQPGGNADHRRVAAVRTERFDDWRHQVAAERIALVKIDVEGAEDRVVAGMTETLARLPPDHIICETSESSHAHAVLSALGYEARRLETAGRLSNMLYSRRTRPAA